MKTERNILIAWILNLAFSVFEFFGGLFTGSVAILSDAVHDLGDGASIGIAYFLEKKSKRQPDEVYTYGYGRYSVLGGLITTVILLVGSVLVICNAIGRIIAPVPIHYNGMIIFAVAGVCVNLGAVYFTREGGSLNQKAVNLHMLEDVLGWVVVLLGAIVMRLTDFSLIDPVMSIGVALFIFFHGVKNLKGVLDMFLEKTPFDVAELKEHLEKLEGVMEVHHIHVWSLDGQNNLATLHIVTDDEPHKVKEAVREELREHGIGHVTVEVETVAEECHHRHCRMEPSAVHHHHAH